MQQVLVFSVGSHFPRSHRDKERSAGDLTRRRPQDIDRVVLNLVGAPPAHEKPMLLPAPTVRPGQKETTCVRIDPIASLAHWLPGGKVNEAEKPINSTGAPRSAPESCADARWEVPEHEVPGQVRRKREDVT